MPSQRYSWQRGSASAGDRSGGAELLDDEKPAVALDDPLHLGQVVPGQDDEAGTVGANLLVLGQRLIDLAEAINQSHSLLAELRPTTED